MCLLAISISFFCVCVPSICSIPLLIYYWVVYLFIFELWDFLIYPGYKVSFTYICIRIISPSLWHAFHFLNGFFQGIIGFNFDTNLSFYKILWFILSKKLLPSSTSHRLSPILYSRSLIVLAFTILSVINFKILLGYGVNYVLKFVLLHINSQLFQYPLLKTL